MSVPVSNLPLINFNIPLCIGIGGVSRSGKTFLAGLLHAAINNSVVIRQDTFIPSESTIPTINNHINWEIPEAIDWGRLKTAAETTVQSGKTVIIEGLFAFQNELINNLYSRAIYITLSRDEFFRRKQVDLRWGKEPDWYINHIWTSFEKYGQLPERFQNALILDGEIEFDLNEIIRFLRSKPGNKL